MTYINEEQRDHRQQEMNETSVVIKFKITNTLTMYFSVVRQEGWWKDIIFISIVVAFCISWFEPYQSFLEGIKYL